MILGLALIAHGLAHASAGMWATDIGGRMLVTLLWELSSGGFIAAGIGLLGVATLQKRWRLLVAVGAVSSLALLLLYGHPLFMAGIVADFLALAIAVGTLRSPFDEAGSITARPRVSRALIVFMAYVTLVIGVRPWHSSWGSSRSEQQMVLIGDPPLGDSHYRIDHAVTIDAPVDSVWQWLVQIGQDRAGFYSYEWLERAFGADIHNANAIVPAWQHRQAGDFVRAAQPNYLGGILGANLGWHIQEIEQGRAMVLESWGAFVVSPDGPRRTRLHIRTRGEGVPTLSGIAITPLALLVFEPAHFIMERGMMLGIKKRAERVTIDQPKVVGLR
ncbi:MAG: hypothetical protein ABI681_09570 [Gemmatimonadales bacterium]